MKSEEKQILIQIAQMYYMENKTQSEIAKELNIHRSSISRLLKTSREEGIVKITIGDQDHQTLLLEEKLRKQFHLKHVSIVTCAKGLSRKQKAILLASRANAYLQTILKDNMVLGFTWGATLSQVARHLTNPEKHTALTCVPLMGGSTGRIRSDFHVNAITYEASRNLNCGALLIDAPAFVQSSETKKNLMRNDSMKSILPYWKRVNIAFFGIGSPKETMNRWRYFYGNDFFQEVEQGGVAGDVAGHYFDVNGTYLSGHLDNYRIGIEKEDLSNIEYRIGIAESQEKLNAIHGALNGGYINALITTQETAEYLIKLAGIL